MIKNNAIRKFVSLTVVPLKAMDLYSINSLISNRHIRVKQTAYYLIVLTLKVIQSFNSLEFKRREYKAI